MSMLRTLLPAGSLRRKVAKKVLRKLGFRRFGARDFYQVWSAQNNLNIPLYPSAEQLTKRPLISVVLPAYNVPAKYLVPLIDSIVGQTYDNWELILLNASTTDATKAVVNECAEIDARIKLVDFPNKGIAANTNEGIRLAAGEYIAFADHDDLIDKAALMEIVKALNKHTQAGLFYTDEDKVSEDGEKYFEPHFKPDWSPDLMTNVNYITHFVVVKKALAEKVGLLNPERDGAQDYDFLWKVIDTGTEVVHIPQILYHWRVADRSTAQDFSSKPRITEAGKASLEEHFARVKEKVTVEVIAQRPGFYKVTYKPSNDISLIILPFANPRLLSLYVELLLRQTNTKGLRLIVPEQVSIDKQYTKSVAMSKVEAANYKDYLRKALKASKQNVLCINQVVLPLNSGWISDMSGLLGVTRIAAAAPLIVNNEREIEDAGLMGDPPSSLFAGHKFSERTYMENTELVRDVDALSGSCIFVRRNELQTFLENQKDVKDENIFTEFTNQQSARGRNNVVWTHVLLNNASFWLQSPSHQSKYFNPSLYTKKDDIRVFNTEEQVMEFLLHVKKEQYHEEL
jgi:glycosyltransferase involved in cell wall biosynthesis